MDIPVTEQNNSDAEVGLEEKNIQEVTEPKEGEGKEETELKPEDSSDGTTPEVDAEAATNAYKYRDEKRKRTALEVELADLKAQIAVPVTEKPVMPVMPLNDNPDDMEAYNKSMLEHNKAMSEYHEKLTDWKLEQRDNLNTEKASQQKNYEKVHDLEKDYNSQVEEAAKKYPDYIDKVEKNMFTPEMHEAIFKSENKAEIAYYLASNQELNTQLLNASPVDVAMEITKLDARLKHSLGQKKTSSAPDPIIPVGGKVDTTPVSESDRDFINRRNKEEFGY